ncbi:phospholipid methyltransferase family protein [Mycobacterium kansasii]|uniref:Phospholipid methyltransferase family protein n=1 Tax=Mycobacterium kansasii TaxID=1768 RepID=A0A1V3WPN9_MYCKA|nr:phospholipid methyltransferase family protein [Mycobacterium kansasii]
MKLVVGGPYRHVRNPMISSVLCILLGEAALAASGWLLRWFATFWAVQVVAIRFWGEPHLRQRYGAEYVEYRRNVPGWIPRISAWRWAFHKPETWFPLSPPRPFSADPHGLH